MCKVIFYVGIDVSQDELYAALEGHKPHSFRHTVSGIKALYSWARKHSEEEATLHFCMESTGVYSRSLALQLLSFADAQVSIINPAQIASYAKAQLRRTKTDGVDTSVILSFAQSQKPSAWTPGSKSLQKLYQLVSQLDALEATKRSWTNRAHSQGYVSDLPKVVDKTRKELLKCLERQIAKIETAIEELCAQEESLSEAVGLLVTTTGLAFHSATHVLAYGRENLTNLSAKALTAHAGLAPRARQSGTSVKGKSHIAKEGDKRLRTALYMPALVSSTHNPIIRHHYQKLLSRGKAKKVALVACMRKLLLIIRAILKTKKPFNPSLIPLT
jgi:transposase